jgi:hypothetical protein
MTSPKQIQPTIRNYELQQKCNNTVLIVQIVCILNCVSSTYVSPDNYMAPKDDVQCVEKCWSKESLRPLIILINFLII